MVHCIGLKEKHSVSDFIRSVQSGSKIWMDISSKLKIKEEIIMRFGIFDLCALKILFDNLVNY